MYFLYKIKPHFLFFFFFWDHIELHISIQDLFRYHRNQPFKTAINRKCKLIKLDEKSKSRRPEEKKDTRCLKKKKIKRRIHCCRNRSRRRSQDRMKSSRRSPYRRWRRWEGENSTTFYINYNTCAYIF